MHATKGSSGARLRLAGLGMALATVTAGCGAVASVVAGPADRPTNPQAIPPILVIGQGASAAGDYRAWAYRTADGWACLEVAYRGGGGSGCSQVNDALGNGMQDGEAGVFVNGSTQNASAVSAAVQVANGPAVTARLVPIDAVAPGTRAFVVGLAPGSQPTGIVFVDAAGIQVDAADLR